MTSTIIRALLALSIVLGTAVVLAAPAAACHDGSFVPDYTYNGEVVGVGSDGVGAYVGVYRWKEAPGSAGCGGMTQAEMCNRDGSYETPPVHAIVPQVRVLGDEVVPQTHLFTIPARLFPGPTWECLSGGPGHVDAGVTFSGSYYAVPWLP